MNILLMNLNPDFSESEQQTLFLARALNSEPCRCVVLCVEDTPLHHHALRSDLETLALPPGTWGKVTGKLRMRMFLRRNPGKWVVHAHDDASAALGYRLCRKHSDLMLMNTRHTPDRVADAKLGDKIRASHVVACETQEIAYAMAEAKVLPRALKIIHGGINTESYPKRLQRNDNRIILACTGRLREGKGHEILIRALASFQQASWLPPWELRISGAGPMFQRLLDTARELGVESHLAFLGGQEPEIVLPDCDILIAPAEHGEGCSMPILDGWAMNLPVICSDSMAHQEIASDGKDSLFFQNSSPEDLAAKLLTLCKDSHLQKDLVEGGRLSLAGYTHTRMASRYMDLYRKLLTQ